MRPGGGGSVSRVGTLLSGCAGLVAAGWAAAAHGSIAVDAAAGAVGLLAGGWVASRASQVADTRRK